MIIGADFDKAPLNSLEKSMSIFRLIPGIYYVFYIARLLVPALLLLVILTALAGCENNAGEPRGGTPYTSDYRNLPDITAEEIEAIERLQEQDVSFVYGALISTEAFYNEHGEIKGFTALFCDWLSQFFQIPFEPAFYEWGDLLDGLATGEIDFTGELTSNEERLKTYFMTDAIAERLVKYVRIAGSEPLDELVADRALRYAFLEGTTTSELVTDLEKRPFEIYPVNDYETAYDLLKSGAIDAFFDEGIMEAAFDEHDDVVFENFFPLIYGPVSLTTQNPDLWPIISATQKALQYDGARYLTELYNKGQQEYIHHKLITRLNDEELDYLERSPVITIVAESDNYPISFYDPRTKQWQGIFFDVLAELKTLTGLTFVLLNDKNTEKATLIELLESGEAMLISDMILTEDLENRFITPQQNIYSDQYSLLSKTELRNIDVNEVLYVNIGMVSDSPPAILFNQWFPDHANTVEYKTNSDALDALVAGRVEMVMSTQNQLLVLTNYRELVGYKSNILFDYPFEFTMGLNKDETLLCSILDGALPLIDYGRISGDWTRKTYDYRDKVALSRLPWLIGTLISLLCLLLLLSAFYRRNSNESKRLESLVGARTSDLNQQHMLMHTVNEAAALLLEADTGDYTKALQQGMEMIGAVVGVDRVNVWQNYWDENDKLRYKQIFKWIRVDSCNYEESVVFDLDYDDTLPRWREMLSQGMIINGYVDSLPDSERAVLEPFKINSFLVVPLFLKGEYWGFVSFDDCSGFHSFPERDAFILRSWGLIVVGAIERGAIAADMRLTLNKLETVIKNYKGIIWSVNKEGIITTFNGQYLETIGVTPQFLEGKRLDIAKMKDRHEDIIDYVQKTFLSGSQEWISDIDGGVFHFNSTPIYDETGVITDVMGSTDDVTEMVRLQRDLRTAVKAAEDASRAKSEFLANMSHEIRTPMNAIIGMTSIGKTASDLDRKDYCFDKIDGASKHLLGVINDILDMSKIEANKFDLSPVEFNLEKMLQLVVNVVNFRIEDKGQSFNIHIDNDIPESLIGDDQRIAQVITNLVGNSVKFTPVGGKINLDTKLVNLDNDDCTIQVAVSDNGIGISPEQQARLFQSFQQAEDSTSRKFGGTGLGLSISKSIVEMMQGKIWVESELDKGSTFAFTVRVKVNPDSVQKPLPQNLLSGKLRVLAVDNDPFSISQLEAIMQRYGVAIDNAADGAGALSLAAGNRYDFYIVERDLPDIDGIKLIRRLKEITPETAGYALLMISSVQWIEMEQEALENGVDKNMSKPIFPSSLVDAINELLGVDKQTAELDKPEIDGLFKGYRVLLAEDVDINQEIVQALLEPTQIEVICADNGLETLNMFVEAPDQYDLIFMDVQMPEMDGYEATRRIRALEMERAKTVPIIAMTANVFKEDIDKCLDAGMDGHIGKPLDLNELVEVLQKYLL